MAKKQSETPASVEFDDLRREIRRDGARTAFDTLLAVCRNPKAPAPARATAATSIFRASGLFEKSDGVDEGKPLSEMTPAELSAAVRRAERQLKAAERDIARGKSDAGPAPLPDVFG